MALLGPGHQQGRWFRGSPGLSWGPTARVRRRKSGGRVSRPADRGCLPPAPAAQVLGRPAPRPQPRPQAAAPPPGSCAGTWWRDESELGRRTRPSPRGSAHPRPAAKASPRPTGARSIIPVNVPINEALPAAPGRRDAVGAQRKHWQPRCGLRLRGGRGGARPASLCGRTACGRLLGGGTRPLLLARGQPGRCRETQAARGTRGRAWLVFQPRCEGAARGPRAPHPESLPLWEGPGWQGRAPLPQQPESPLRFTFVSGGGAPGPWEGTASAR